ncbi:low molecular weight phosphatase family protein [Microbacterium sp. NPDC087589]|uniref:arsenate-mycothiol transferase ArsC n=1 Tax=Microbacterium sp. NPDC087589 TaxID=3364191 RepID=UPI003823AD71
MTDTSPTVLFICQHNAGRSQLGAALLQHLAGDRFVATSAGLSPSDEVNPAVAATVAELGMDITDRVPRAVSSDDLDAADVVVLMKPGLTLPSTPQRRGAGVVVPEPRVVGCRRGAPAARGRRREDPGDAAHALSSRARRRTAASRDGCGRRAR